MGLMDFPQKCKHRGCSCRPRVAWLRNIWLTLGVLVTFLCCLFVSNRPSFRSGKMGFQKHRRERAVDQLLIGSLPQCPIVPPNLRGRQDVEMNVSLEEAEIKVEGVTQGGFWSPSHCQPRWRVAIVVPFRDRVLQLGAFLYHMHNFLQRQELNYTIYVVEQEGDDLFNRARLLNVGFLEAQKEGPWDCVAFHDVDMLPEDDRHLYHCSQQPRHLAVGTSNHKYKLPYSRYFGGACLMTKEQVELVNGWSNIYWGWGGEDDDMWRRIYFSDMQVWRYRSSIARYSTIRHNPQELNQNRFKILERNTGRFPYDGLNSLKYKVWSKTRKFLYTHIVAHIGSSNEKNSGMMWRTTRETDESNVRNSTSEK